VHSFDFGYALSVVSLAASCKQNLLQGEAAPAAARTTRIFVARIPQSVTDTQFRSYFEKYGRLQDAYMPRDHSRQMYRGIGFVTFASPESVEKVMACKHWCVLAGSAAAYLEILEIAAAAMLCKASTGILQDAAGCEQHTCTAMLAAVVQCHSSRHSKLAAESLTYLHSTCSN
jgi:hypothetical protein